MYALARGERTPLWSDGLVAEVGPAAADDRVVDVGGLRLGLLEAGAVPVVLAPQQVRSVRVVMPSPRRRVVADGVGAEVDQDGGEVGRRGGRGRGDGDLGGAGQAQVPGERPGGEAGLLGGRRVDLRRPSRSRSASGRR